MGASTALPLVSVIVPVFNVEGLLRRCVDSVLAQTYAHLEVILIDDGSPDGSGAICDEYAARDPRVRVVHQANMGLSGARNTGIDAAQGEYLSFLDADDWWHHGYVSHLLELLCLTQADIAGCRMRRTDIDVADAPLPDGHIVWDRTSTLMSLFGPHRAILVVAWGKVFRRTLFDDVRFPLGRVHEDEFTAHRVLAKATTLVLSDAAAYYYWQRPDSITGVGTTLTSSRDSMAAARDQLQHLANLGDPLVARAATLHLLRRLTHHIGWLTSNGRAAEADERRSELHALLRSTRGMRLGIPVQILGYGYVRLPRVAQALHRGYLGAREYRASVSWR